MLQNKFLNIPCKCLLILIVGVTIICAICYKLYQVAYERFFKSRKITKIVQSCLDLEQKLENLSDVLNLKVPDAADYDPNWDSYYNPVLEL